MIGTTFADRYRIGALLGQGANGRVWLATDLHRNMQVALKTFGPGAPNALAYLEATVLTALEGEHVLKVSNADTYQDVPYIATRVASLGSAEDLLKTNPRGLPANAVVSWTRQSLVGLGSCHDRDLVHRDIKPANLFLEREDKALLGDFGLVYQVDANGEVPAEGTLLTMAPEMWSAGVGTRASDLYSFGVTMYRMLSGKWPIEAPTRAEFHPLVTTGTYPDLRDIAPHVSRRLARRVRRAMALDPLQRYPSWRAMHEDLGRPGVIGVIWTRTAPHAGHESCWTEVAKRSVPRHAATIKPTKAKAVNIGRELAGSQRARLIEHGTDGRILKNTKPAPKNPK